MNLRPAIHFLLALPLLALPASGQTDYVLDYQPGDALQTPGSYAALNNLSQLTLELELRVDSITNWTNILSRIVGPSDRVALQAHQGKLYCIVSNGSNSYAYTPGAVLTPGTKAHIAMVFDGNLSNKMKLYVDGVAQSLTFSSAALPSTTPTNTAAFGAGLGAAFLGQVDEVRVWRAALSGFRIGNWMGRNLDASHPEIGQLDLYWNLDDHTTPGTANGSLNTSVNGVINGAVYVPESAPPEPPPMPLRRDTVIGGYLPYYKMGSVSPRIFEELTHLYYFSIAPDPGGNLGRVDGAGVFTPIASIPSIQTDIATLLTWRGLSPTKILVALGGWVQSDYLDEAAANPASRANLVANLKQFCLTNGIDGVDIDWEGYHGPVNETNYGLLINELDLAFQGTDLLITATISPTSTSFVDEFAKADLVQIMTYGANFGGGTQVPLATLEAWVNGWVANGQSKRRLVIGLPAFARTPANGSSLTYAEIVQLYNPPASQDAIQHNGVTYFFNGLDTIRDKVRFAAQQDLRGVMFWELGQDLPVADPKSLLGAASDSYPRMKKL